MRVNGARRAAAGGSRQMSCRTTDGGRRVDGRSLLCNGIVLFDDLGELLPNGRALAPRVDFAARIGRVDH